MSSIGLRRAGRRLLVGAGALLFAAGVGCAGTGGVQPPHEVEPQLELASVDADVWAFHTRVAGTSRTGVELAACVVVVGAREYAAAARADAFAADVELEPGTNQVHARCRTRAGRELRSSSIRYRVRLSAETELAFGAGASAETPSATEQRRAWLERAVVYGVLPPLFGTRGLRDVQGALDSLHELGVDTLWLAPIFAAPDGDFGYAVTDYFEVRGDYGSAADLRALTAAAHARQMRVLLDLPANHSSSEHPYFLQAQRLGRRSHYFDFYERDPRGAPAHYFDWDHLPNLDYDHPEVERFMLEVARHWVRAFGVDGYRVDAVWGIRRRNPEYLPRWSAGLRRLRPDVLLLAEAPANDPYYLQQGFDAAYDWGAELGHPAWEHVFDSPHGIAKRLHAAVRATHERAGQYVLRFLNNNDTGPRFITRHGEGLTRVATAALLTLPGVPCLYSFDEVGAEFEPYGELRPIAGGNAALRSFHQRWIAARRTHPALSGAGYTALISGEQGEVLAFVRSGHGQSALVVLNFAEQPISVELELPDSLQVARGMRDLLSGEPIALAGRRISLQLRGWDARAFEPL